MKIEVMLPKPRKSQKLAERPGPNPSLEDSEGAWSYWLHNFRPLASKALNKYISVVLSHSTCGALLR